MGVVAGKSQFAKQLPKVGFWRYRSGMVARALCACPTLGPARRMPSILESVFDSYLFEKELGSNNSVMEVPRGKTQHFRRPCSLGGQEEQICHAWHGSLKLRESLTG